MAKTQHEDWRAFTSDMVFAILHNTHGSDSSHLSIRFNACVTLLGLGLHVQQ
jgi:hypothetical protein